MLKRSRPPADSWYYIVHRKGEKNWANALNSVLSLISLRIHRSMLFADVSLDESNRKRVIKMTWPAPKTLSRGEGERYPLRRGAAGNKTFKSSGVDGGGRTRGSEQCNNLGESYSVGAGEPLMNFEL